MMIERGTVLRVALWASILAGPPMALADTAPFDRDLLGDKIGELSGNQVELDFDNGPVKLRASFRGIMYGGLVVGADESAAPDAFSGSGESYDDMIEAMDDEPSPPLLRRYIDLLDPGGKTILVEFYEDREGCETDIVTRREPDGTLRTLFVDSTGWIDRPLQVAGQNIDRRCVR